MSDENILDQDIIKCWEKTQVELKEKLICYDTEAWHQDVNQLKLIGGIDISYAKEDNSKAFVSLVVLDADNDFKCVYTHSTLVTMTTPYIPGFLAFREVDHLVKEVQVLCETNPQLMPQVWLIDGNGTLHPREFGLACHFGVLHDVATIGVAKNPYFLNFIDANKKKEQKDKFTSLETAGQWIPIFDINDEKVIGAALKTKSNCQNPVYVSIGHRVSLETTIRVVLKCCKYKIPEPTRQADIISREQIRLM